MSDAARNASLEGIRMYLKRTKTQAELEALATALMTETPEDFETVLTNVGFGAQSASAIARGIDRFQVLKVVEELIAEMSGDLSGVTNVVARTDFSFGIAGN